MKRHVITRETITALVLAERQRQIAKWGVQDMSFADWVLVLNEEMGELARELWEAKDPENTLTEAVQVSAMVTQIYEAHAGRGKDYRPSPKTVIDSYNVGYKLKTTGDPKQSYLELLTSLGSAIVCQQERGAVGMFLNTMGYVSCRMIGEIMNAQNLQADERP